MKSEISAGLFEWNLENENGTLLANGKPVSVDSKSSGPGEWHLLIEGKSYRVILLEREESGKGYKLEVNGKVVSVTINSPLDKLLKKMGMSSGAGQKVNELKAPMPGLIREVKVSPGQALEPGDPVIVLEAMKMENVLKSPGKLTVRSIQVTPGDKVEKMTVLVHFE